MMQNQYIRYSLPSQYTNQRCLIPQHLNAQSPIIYSKKKLENINCIEQPISGYGGLFLGDIISVIKVQIINTHKIRAIISCNGENQNPLNYPDVIRKYIPAKDTLDYPINIHFQQSSNFIEQMRQQNRNVLVHCHAGISRSASLVCAYLMRKYSWKMNQTLQYIKQKRQRIRPNQTFLSLLSAYELQLNNLKQSIHLNQPNQNLYQTAVIHMKNMYQSPKPTVLTHKRQSSCIPKMTSSNFLVQSNSYGMKKQSYEQSTKDKNHSFISDNSHFFPKNRVSMKLGRKTRIPWHLAQQKQGQSLDTIKRNLFKAQQQSKEVYNYGCML